MSEQEVLAVIIGRTVALFPSQVKELLKKNAVVLDAENYDTSKLIETVINGLTSSQPFAIDFQNLVKSNESLIVNL